MQTLTLKSKASATLLWGLLLIAGSLSSIAQTDSWTQKSDIGYSMVNVPEPSARLGAVGFSIGNKGYIGTGFDQTYKKDLWEYDPVVNAWTQRADFGGVGRSGAVGFSIGSKGYVGTGKSYDDGTIFYKDFWEYDPALNTWTQKADFGGIARYWAVGFNISTKGYLGTGNTANNSYNRDFWEYDPTLDSWIQKADFGGLACHGAVGFSIGNKGYLGTGFSSNGGPKKEFWEYDPTLNSWTQKSDFAGPARFWAVGFSIGNNGYVGTGYNNYLIYYKDFWEYDPALNAWIQKTDFPLIERYNAIGFSINGKGYLGTGSTYYNEEIYHKDFWEYDPVLNNWVEKADFGGPVRYDAVGFHINNKGYLGTGQSKSGYAKDFWEYDPALNTWMQKADFAGTARANAIAFSIGGKGYAGTGYDGSFTKDFWEYDPVLNTWKQKADFGGSAREKAVGYSIGSKGYVGTGYDGGPRTDFWEYDPDANTWKKKAAFGGIKRYSAIGFSIGSKGYIGTGYKSGINYKDFWEYDPALNSWTPKADFGGTARYNAVGFNIDSKGYVGTGYNSYNGTLYKDFWEYDPALNAWTQKSDFGGNARVLTVGFSIGSKGYVGTGSGNGAYQDFWEYTPETTSCPIPLMVTVDDITITKATVTWIGNDLAYSYRIRKRPVGTETWVYSSVTAPTTTKTLSNNTPYTDYEVQVQAYCDSLKTDSSGYTTSVFFTSLATCPLPQSVVVSDITDSKATVSWTGNPDAYSYRIRKRPVGTDFWIYSHVDAPITSKVLTNNLSVTEYEVQVQTYCDSLKTDSSGYTASVFFTSQPSCPFPQLVIVSDVTESIATISWTGNSSAYSYLVRSRSEGSPYWIYYSAVIAPINSKIISNLNAGTLYEVQIQTYCDSLKTDSSGYTASVNFTSGSNCPGINTAYTSDITNTSVTLNWTYSNAPEKWKIKHRQSVASNWTTKKISGNLSSYLLTFLIASTDYEWKIQAKCGDDESDWSPVQHFSTSLRLTGDINNDLSFSIYPNPAKDQTTIQFTLTLSSHVNIKMYDVRGKEIEMLLDDQLQEGKHSLQLNTAQFSKGIYFVRMISDNGMQNQKLIVH